jgi:hypothetical protein
VIDEIICIGTSFTWGDSTDVRRNKDAVEWYKLHHKINVSRETHSYPSLIETLTGIKTRNLGKCGSSLEYLIRNTENIIENENLTNKLFILEYSNWGRAELWSNKHNQHLISNWGPRDGNDSSVEGWASYITLDYAKEYPDTNEVSWDFTNEMKIYDSYLDNFHNETEYLIKIDRNFLNLLYKLYYKNIKFLVIPLENLFWNGLKDDILLNNNMESFKTKDGMGLYGFIAENKLRLMDLTNGIIQDGHPSIFGYQTMTNKIIDKLKEQNML